MPSTSSDGAPLGGDDETLGQQSAVVLLIDAPEHDVAAPEILYRRVLYLLDPPGSQDQGRGHDAGVKDHGGKGWEGKALQGVAQGSDQAREPEKEHANDRDAQQGGGQCLQSRRIKADECPGQ